MNTTAYPLTDAHWSGWWQWLRRELAFAPGREITTVRIVVTVALVTVISMSLRVPEAAISAYMVFFVTKENRVLTTLTGALLILGTTLAIAGSLCLYRYTFDYSALRVPMMAIVVFTGMYLSRVFVIGPLGFAIGFVVAITQSTAETIPDAETLVRALLWIWVAIVYPAALTVLVNQVLLPAEPWTALTRALLIRLDAAEAALRRASEDGVIGGRSDGALLDLATRGSAPLLTLLHWAEVKNTRLKRRHASLAEVIAASERLVNAAAALEMDERQALSEGDRRCVQILLIEIAQLRTALPSREPVAVETRLNGATTSLPALRELQLAAITLHDNLEREESTEASTAFTPTKQKKPLFVADAFTNPAHVHFALKVTLAAMGCYVIYTGLNWPGIRTAFITCCFIALENAGATRRKGTLRLVGCCVGGLLGFLSIMYLVPQMESIVSLVLLTAAVSALAGWVAAGSDRIAYAGLQIALAFYLCLFQGFTPDTDFNKIRDRLVGIVLGIAVSTLVFRSIWPEHAATQLRAVLARTLRDLADFLTVPSLGIAPALQRQEAMEQRRKVAAGLAEAVRLSDLIGFENQDEALGRHRVDQSVLRPAILHTQAVYLIAAVLSGDAELGKWEYLPFSVQNAETGLRSSAAELLRRFAAVTQANETLNEDRVEFAFAAWSQAISEESENDRSRLLRQLGEQLQQLGTIFADVQDPECLDSQSDSNKILCAGNLI